MFCQRFTHFLHLLVVYQFYFAFLCCSMLRVLILLDNNCVYCHKNIIKTYNALICVSTYNKRFELKITKCNNDNKKTKLL